MSEYKLLENKRLMRLFFSKRVEYDMLSYSSSTVVMMKWENNPVLVYFGIYEEYDSFRQIELIW